MNVIDTLSAGFGAANRRLWIVIIPIVVDLFLWLGPKLVAGPVLATQIEGVLHQQYANSGLGVQQMVASFNLFSVLVLYLPSLIVRLDSIAPLASAAPVIPVGSPWLFALGGFGILLVGLHRNRYVGRWFFVLPRSARAAAACSRGSTGKGD